MNEKPNTMEDFFLGMVTGGAWLIIGILIGRKLSAPHPETKTTRQKIAAHERLCVICGEKSRQGSDYCHEHFFYDSKN